MVCCVPDGKNDAINLTPPKHLSLTLTLPLLQFLAALVQLLLVTTNFKSELHHMLCDLTIQRHTVAITYDLSGELTKFTTQHTHTQHSLLFTPLHHTPPVSSARVVAAENNRAERTKLSFHSHSHSYMCSLRSSGRQLSVVVSRQLLALTAATTDNC